MAAHKRGIVTESWKLRYKISCKNTSSVGVFSNFNPPFMEFGTQWSWERQFELSSPGKKWEKVVEKIVDAFEDIDILDVCRNAM